MTTISENDIKQMLAEIKAGQQTQMTITKKQLELYVQHIAKSDELNNQLFQLQKQNFLTQRVVLLCSLGIIISVLIYAFMH